MLREKIVFIENKSVDEINRYLENGWIVKNVVAPSIYKQTSWVNYGAYVVIQKED